MSAQHITQDTRFERAQMAVGSRMSNPEWLNEAWGTQLDCDDISKRMCAAIADGDEAQAGAILRDALNAIATREASKDYGVTL